MRILWLLLSGIVLICPNLAFPANTAARLLELPRTGLEARELAVIVNDDDPLSAPIADYYRQRREIPAENIVHVRFPAKSPNLPRDQFTRVMQEVEGKLGAHIQAYALAWTKPYRVDCMSITSAFALGFDPSYCSQTQCASTKPSGYFNSGSREPYTDHKIRPAMLLAGLTLADAKALIDRGVASDYTYPTGTAYLLDTSDKHRSVRSVFFENTIKLLGNAFNFQRLRADSIKGKKDVLFYFTGLAKVPDLPSLHFVPGAIADHLTSAGGQLTDSFQMSSLRWLEAGATGSYGTVVEPCNRLEKFPNPGVAMLHYAEGSTLVEAYWKSVATPGEGVFIGEPLAKPFAPRLLLMDEDGAVVKMFSPEWKNLLLETADSPIGPYRQSEIHPASPGLNVTKIHLASPSAFYRLVF